MNFFKDTFKWNISMILVIYVIEYHLEIFNG